MLKNIVLFGGSNSILQGGLRAGLAEHAKLVNLALGACTITQNLYELNKESNKDALKNADLIITESNINEITQNSDEYERLPLEVILRNTQWFYEGLYRLAKPVCVLILPRWIGEHKRINNIHRYFATKYGFCVIDLQKYYEKQGLVDFGKIFGSHPMIQISKDLGENIAKNVDLFKMPKLSDRHLPLPEFLILPASKCHKHGNLKSFVAKNSLLNKEVLRLEKGNFLSLEDYKDYQIIAFQSWNLDNNGVVGIKVDHNCSPLLLGSAKHQVRKCSTSMCAFCEIHDELIIDNDFVVKLNDDFIINTEFSNKAVIYKKGKIQPYFDLIDLFLCKGYNKNELIKLETIPAHIKIPTNIDFTYLAPDIKFYAKSMRSEILAFSLGTALIAKPKSIFGYAILPFRLAYIMLKYYKKNKISNIYLTKAEKARYQQFGRYKLGVALTNIHKKHGIKNFINLVKMLSKEK